MNIGDVYIYKICGEGFSVIINTFINTYSPHVKNKVRYLYLTDDLCYLPDKCEIEVNIDLFESYFTFSQKLTDEHLIKNIIE